MLSDEPHPPPAVLSHNSNQADLRAIMTDIAFTEVPLPPSWLETIDKIPYRVGFVSQALWTGNRFAYNENEVFAQASAIKIPILWHLESQAASGLLSLDERLVVDPTNGAGGCGILQRFSHGGSQLSLTDLAMLMITQSDNVATNLLIDRLTPEAINQQLEELGLVETRLRRHMMDFEARDSGQENTSTPAEALQLLLEIDRRSKPSDRTTGNIVTEKEAATKVLETLRLKKESPFTAALPTTATFANKPGMLKGLRTEWAIVSDTTQNGQPIEYAVAIMLESDDSYDDSQLKQDISEIGSLIHNQWLAAASS